MCVLVHVKSTEDWTGADEVTNSSTMDGTSYAVRAYFI